MPKPPLALQEITLPEANLRPSVDFISGTTSQGAYYVTASVRDAAQSPLSGWSLRSNAVPDQALLLLQDHPRESYSNAYNLRVTCAGFVSLAQDFCLTCRSHKCVHLLLLDGIQQASSDKVPALAFEDALVAVPFGTLSAFTAATPAMAFVLDRIGGQVTFVYEWLFQARQTLDASGGVCLKCELPYCALHQLWLERTQQCMPLEAWLQEGEPDVIHPGYGADWALGASSLTLTIAGAPNFTTELDLLSSKHRRIPLRQGTFAPFASSCDFCDVARPCLHDRVLGRYLPRA